MLIPGLQITVGHRTLATQNLLLSNEIPNVVGHYVRQFLDHKSFYQRMNKNLSDHNFVLSDQDGFLVGHMYMYVLSSEKNYLQPCYTYGKSWCAVVEWFNL